MFSLWLSIVSTVPLLARLHGGSGSLAAFLEQTRSRDTRIAAVIVKNTTPATDSPSNSLTGVKGTQLGCFSSQPPGQSGCPSHQSGADIQPSPGQGWSQGGSVKKREPLSAEAGLSGWNLSQENLTVLVSGPVSSTSIVWSPGSSRDGWLPGSERIVNEPMAGSGHITDKLYIVLTTTRSLLRKEYLFNELCYTRYLFFIQRNTILWLWHYYVKV